VAAPGLRAVAAPLTAREGTISVLDPEPRFSSLSVKDLIEARDLYHDHLVHKPNVVGTAIGRYLIRNDEPWLTRTDAERMVREQRYRQPQEQERTFENSGLRPDSLPAVLVLVRKWAVPSQFADGTYHPADMIPTILYMPDGRTVPVCVIRVTPGEPRAAALPEWHWPSSRIGGGYPLLINTQGSEHTASVGCLVTDGNRVYALTNRHVCGDAGSPVRTILRGREVEIGRSSDKQLTRKPFSEVYTDYKGRRTYLTLDAGLIDVDDVNQWTSSVYGLENVGDLADISEVNISLRLIGASVRAHGAASGPLEGRVAGLFHRYRSVGGYDDVADFLIAPDKEATGQTREGDSGTVWHLVERKPEAAGGEGEAARKETLRPLALQWGGQVFLDGQGQSSFALATGLSNILRLLDVELVTDHNTSAQPYWGQIGHYGIASFACDQAKGKLRKLMQANRQRISFEFPSGNAKAIAAALKQAKSEGFIPLADVPDLVWKKLPWKVTGGRDTQALGQGRSTGPEHPTHYADVDAVWPGKGKTLLKLCLDDPKNVDVEIWRQYYAANGHNDPRDQGLLPFRVWQFFDEMVKFAGKKARLDRFLAAAGLVAHYVGDACQPLHGSVFSDGFPGPPKRGGGVHSAYETDMIDRKSDKLIVLISAELANPGPTIGAIATGRQAAIEVVRLMGRSAKTLPPRTLINTFINAGGTNHVAVLDAMWAELDHKTALLMADGARVLARIWEGAWAAAGGEGLPNNALGLLNRDRVQQRYLDDGFVPSLELKDIGSVLVP
jgi:hypothetical protein